ncbi:MAG TPA: hypothetical protein VMF89_13210 [Polyangiales bacterium]|nr:hypothetical protein [Polyangiales bacterium]
MSTPDSDALLIRGGVPWRGEVRESAWVTGALARCRWQLPCAAPIPQGEAAP